MFNDLKNINHTIIKNTRNNCFICLNDVDYFIKFDCECHNYLHINCADSNFLNKCFICHKKTKKVYLLKKNYDIFIQDYELLNYIMEIKINNILFNQKLIIFLKSNPNFISILLYFIFSVYFTFGILLPIIILSVFVNIIKYLFYKDNVFFSLKNLLCLILTIGFITLNFNNKLVI